MKSINTNLYQKNLFQTDNKQNNNIYGGMVTPNIHPNEQSLQNDMNQPIQLHPYDSIEIKCNKIQEINQNLKYNIGLLEMQLELLKKIQKDKIDQSKKIKEKGKNKLQREVEIKRHIKLQNDKFNKLLSGYKLINNEATQMQSRQQKTREHRLKAQQSKNQAYQQYNAMEKQYKQLVYNIKEKDGLLQELIHLQRQNQSLNSEIKQLQQLLNQEQTSRNDVANLKKQRNSKIKEFNMKVLQLQKQESNLKSQINNIENSLLMWQSQKQRIEQKSAQQLRIYQKIQQARSFLATKRTQFADVDSTYKQLCLQQTRMKKQIILERQCNQARRKYKQGLKIGKPLSSPKMQAVKQASPQKSIQLQSNNQMNKLQILAKRFQNLNNQNRR